MLIAAIPKSASTALMETLARAQDLPCDMHFRWSGAPSEEFPSFHMQHAFGWELDPDSVTELTRPGIIHKSHILPSRNNLAALRHHPKVVLLRTVEGIIGAYKRGQETGVYTQKTRHFDTCETLEDWIATARNIGLYGDLHRFREGWLAAENRLIVDYEDLIADPGPQIAVIEAYLGLPLSGTEDLLRRKYTRLGEKSLAYHRQTVSAWKNLSRSEEEK